MKNRMSRISIVVALLAFAGAMLVGTPLLTPVALATAPTALPIITPVGPYPATVGALALNFAFTAADASNGNSIALTAHEVLLAYNSDTGSHTITFTSAADLQGRTQDITSYALGAGLYAVFNYRGGLNGWKQGDGTAHVTANDATVKFAVLYVP